jgi:hypothetical protein
LAARALHGPAAGAFGKDFGGARSQGRDVEEPDVMHTQPLNFLCGKHDLHDAIHFAFSSALLTSLQFINSACFLGSGWRPAGRIKPQRGQCSQPREAGNGCQLCVSTAVIASTNQGRRFRPT